MAWTGARASLHNNHQSLKDAKVNGNIRGVVPVLLVAALAWDGPEEDVEAFFSRNFLLMLTELNFLGWGMLRVGAADDPGVAWPFAPRRGAEPAPGDGDAGAEGCEGALEGASEGASDFGTAGGSSLPFAGDPWTAEGSCTPFAPSAFVGCSDRSRDSTVAIDASGDANWSLRVVNQAEPAEYGRKK